MSPFHRAVAGLVILMLAGGSAGAAASGDPAPPLGLETLLQAPPGTDISWQALRGKVVVLEFWATWCAPCIAAISHLNELAGEFASEPVAFIAISDEKEEVVRKLLETRPIRGWVGLDADRSAFDACGVQGLPATVVVDREGIVEAITAPESVTPEAIRALLRGERIQIPPRTLRTVKEMKRAAEDVAGDPLYEVEIRPSGGTEKKVQIRGGEFLQMASTLLEAMTSAYGIDSTRIVAEKPLREGRFDFVITATGSTDFRMSLMRQAIETTFQLRTRREEREMRIYRLLGSPGAGGALLRNDTGEKGFFSEEGGLDVSSLSSGELARFLEVTLGIPVIDETGLPGRYDLHLRWKDSLPAGLERELRKATGLSLVADRRRIEVLVVEEKAAP